MRQVRQVCAALVMALALLPALSPGESGRIAAQEVPGRIAGTVVEKTTLRPVGGALVTIQGTNQSVMTNPQGRFTLTGIRAPVGEAVPVRVQLIGYASQTARIAVGCCVEQKSCALGGSRTHNHLIRSQALYPLSYEGAGNFQWTLVKFKTIRVH